MSPESYYKHIKTLGLVHYAPDLAKLCPNQELKSSLLALAEGDPDRQTAAKPRIDQRQESEKFVNLASILRTSKKASPSSASEKKPLNLMDQSSDFPSVGETYKQKGGRSANQKQQSDNNQGTTTAATPTTVAPGGPVPTRRFQPPQNYTAQDKKANKDLMERLKQELDQEAFAAFRVESVNYLKGASAAEDYYHMIISLGLAEYLDSLANLCPDLSKRKALRDLHKASLMAQMQYSGGGGSSRAGNSNPRSFAEDDSSGGNSKKGKGKKKKKQGKFEKMRLGQGVSWDDALGINSSNSSGRGRTNPNNSWSHGSGNNLF
jgi:hypothetical protein